MIACRLSVPGSSIPFYIVVTPPPQTPTLPPEQATGRIYVTSAAATRAAEQGQLPARIKSRTGTSKLSLYHRLHYSEIAGYVCLVRGQQTYHQIPTRV